MGRWISLRQLSRSAICEMNSNGNVSDSISFRPPATFIDLFGTSNNLTRRLLRGPRLRACADREVGQAACRRTIPGGDGPGRRSRVGVRMSSEPLQSSSSGTRHRIGGSAHDSLGPEGVLGAGVRVGRSPWCEGVGCQIERIADDDLGALRSDELPDLEEIRTRLVFGGQHERLVVCRALDQTEGRRDDIHLPVADKDVAVAPDELDRLVLVDVAAAGVEKVTMADDEIDHWIPVAVGLFRIENSVMS